MKQQRLDFPRYTFKVGSHERQQVLSDIAPPRTLCASDKVIGNVNVDRVMRDVNTVEFFLSRFYMFPHAVERLRRELFGNHTEERYNAA